MMEWAEQAAKAAKAGLVDSQTEEAEEWIKVNMAPVTKDLEPDQLFAFMEWVIHFLETLDLSVMDSIQLHALGLNELAFTFFQFVLRRTPEKLTPFRWLLVDWKPDFSGFSPASF